MGVYWFLFVAAVLAYAQSFFFKKTANLHLIYERQFSKDSCYQGDQIEMIERIQNYKPLPVPWMRLESMMPAALEFGHLQDMEQSQGTALQNHRSFFSLMPYTKITRRHIVRAAKRGVYPLHSATMTCGDILGLKSTSQTIELPGELIVYPEFMPIEDVPLPSHSWQGDLVVRRWIVDDPFIIAGTREYRDGDSLNTVNWKATARTNTLQVHQRDFTADHRLIICLNVEVHETMWREITDEELVEKGIRYAAAIARHAVEQGMEVGFLCNAELEKEKGEPIRTEVLSGTPQLEYLLETMARLRLIRSKPFEVLLEQDVEMGMTNADYVIITPFVSEAIQTQLESLLHLGNACEIIYLSNEEESHAQ